MNEISVTRKILKPPGSNTLVNKPDKKLSGRVEADIDGHHRCHHT